MKRPRKVGQLQHNLIRLGMIKGNARSKLLRFETKVYPLEGEDKASRLRGSWLESRHVVALLFVVGGQWLFEFGGPENYGAENYGAASLVD